MPLTADDIKRLIYEDDGATIEMKRHLPPDASVARIFSAFANSSGGVLAIGVDEEGDVFGLSDAEVEFVSERMREIAESLLPGKTEIQSVTVEGRQLVYAAIGRAPDGTGPIATARGKIYTRRDQEVVRLKPRPIEISNVTRTIKVFVAMSFREEEEPALIDYWQAMQRAANSAAVPLTLCRVDLRQGDYEISQTVMEEIDKSDIVVADFTLSSPNVYFELGYARGKQKRLIQTARKETVLEFDVRNWRTIFYRNATELEQKLVPALRAAYDELTSAG